MATMEPTHTMRFGGNWTPQISLSDNVAGRLGWCNKKHHPFISEGVLGFQTPSTWGGMAGGPQKHTDQTPFTSGGMTGRLGIGIRSILMQKNRFQQDVLFHLFCWTPGRLFQWTMAKCNGSYCDLLIAADGSFVCFFTCFVSVCLLYIRAQHKLIISVLSWSRFKRCSLQPLDTTWATMFYDHCELRMQHVDNKKSLLWGVGVACIVLLCVSWAADWGIWSEVSLPEWYTPWN